jgi:methylmalonyl-CoA mutase
MSEVTPELNLAHDFPPVPTAAWEAAVQKDLNGADYEKRLVWHTEEGVAVRPYYRSEALAGLEAQLQFQFSDGDGAWEIAENFSPRPDAIRADLLHEAGAHAVQELGYALAAGVERFEKLMEDRPLEVAASEIEFAYAIGPSYFLEIAKLRAARLLWARAVSAFASSSASPVSASPMRIVVRTARRNKSIYDRYTNMLRATTEAMSAAIGGCDELTVEPFGFDPHLAVNIQRILKEEAHLDAVADAASGSYYVEALTDALAREAWQLFQHVEAQGGYAQALSSGSIAISLGASRATREKAISSRRRSLVGVNNYPNVAEKTPGVAALPAFDGDPLPQIRQAEPFERLRERTARHAAAIGRYPKILLLEKGDVKMCTARANFCLNFVGCAGFDIVEADAVAGIDADLVILCSSDAEYLALAQEVCAQVTVPVIVAGSPKEQVAALKAAGVQGFVHAQSDAVQTLTELQNRLGMGELR